MPEPAITADALRLSVEGTPVVAPATTAEKVAAEAYKGRSIRTVVVEGVPTVDSIKPVIDKLVLDTGLNAQVLKTLRHAEAVLQKGTALDAYVGSNPDFQKSLEAIMLSDPALAAMYTGLPTADAKRKFLVDILNRAETKQAITDAMAMLSPEQLAASFEGDRSGEIQAELDQLNAELADKTTRKSVLEVAIQTDEEELSQFASRLDVTKKPPVTEEGLFVKELQGYDETIAASIVDEGRYKSESQGVRTALADLYKLRDDYLRTHVVKDEGFKPFYNPKTGVVMPGEPPTIGFEHVDVSGGPAAEAYKRLEAAISVKETELKVLADNEKKAAGEKAKASTRRQALLDRKDALVAKIKDDKTELTDVTARLALLPTEIAKKNSEL